MAKGPFVLDYSKAQRRRISWAEAKTVAILAGVLVPIETGCAILAYHTLGDVASAFYYLLIMVNFIPLLIGLVNRRVAVIGLLVIVMLIVPYQLFLGVRWWRVHREADRLVHYLQSGAPGSTYVFRDIGTRRFITIAPGGSRSLVDYWIGTPTTSHWYDPSQGWCYYPD